MTTVKTKKQLKSSIIREMKNLNTYKKEYNNLIEIYAGLLHQYQVFEMQFEESGYQITEEYTNKANATNQRKVPILTAMESLRKDIVSYSDRLCLNPKSLNIEQPKKSEPIASPLDQFLAKK
ncbi:P27 family phage terminase small subunit [Lysinibacillus xylanilyticus]|uniref:P27 family phage terminase small subunit n=1 Tax=Lysinibacillus xylanilyticus TaxID=582475 RepID=UPI003818972D